MLTSADLIQPAGEIDAGVANELLGDSPSALAVRLDAYLTQAYATLGAFTPAIPPGVQNGAARNYGYARFWRALALAVSALPISETLPGDGNKSYNTKAADRFDARADQCEAAWEAVLAGAAVPPTASAKTLGSASVRARIVW